MGPMKKKTVDFTVELDKEVGEFLEKIVASWKPADINRMAGTYSLSYIRSLGTPLYQLHLVQRLVDFFNANQYKPMRRWESILANPSEYLDPAFYIQREHERELETERDEHEQY